MRAEVRPTVAERGKRDLFFLCKTILGYPDIDKDVHGPVCDFFVHKDPSKPIGKQDRVKNRLLLDPRGHLKTTINLADDIQWMLCFPDIRLLLMSGSYKLSQEKLAIARGHFMKNKDFRAVYPEYCPPLDGEWGTLNAFTLPNRVSTFLGEPTMSIATMDSAKAGSHYDGRDGDDLINEVNSQNREQLMKIGYQWRMSKPLLNPGGYSKLVGTRYDFSDEYGEIIEKHSKDWKIFCRACWEIDHLGNKTVLFPKKFCLDGEEAPEKENLDSLQRDDPAIFACQYLNNPLATGSQLFPLKMLTEHTIPRADIPSDLILFMTWFLGFDPKAIGNEPRVGIVGGFSETGNLYIIDAYRGIWSSHNTIEAVIHALRKWPIRRIGLGETESAVLLAPGLEAKAREVGFPLPVDWLPVKRNMESRIKSVESLQSLFMMNKVWFNADMPHLDHLFNEFSRFPKYKYSQIPEAVAMLSQHYRGSSQELQNPNLYENPEIVVSCVHSMFGDLQQQRDAEGYGDGELGGGLVG